MQEHMFETKQLLTDKEAAEYLALSVATLRKWRWLGGKAGPPFRKLGGAVRYPAAMLRAWLQAQPGGGACIPERADGDRPTEAR
jgi:predicted DNA-binding transcriptional regulator AlpA